MDNGSRHDGRGGQLSAQRYLGMVVALLWVTMFAAHASAAAGPGAQIANTGADRPGAVACTSCHGPDGGGNEQAGFPRLAGLDEDYLATQLQAFKQGRRKNPVMSGMAAPQTQHDIEAVAGYYAGLEPVSHAKAPKGVSTDAGARLAQFGDMQNRGLPACFQCHGPQGVGVGSSFPPLVGQPYAYLLAQLKAWKSGARTGEPLGLMKAVADKLTGPEAESVAAYFAGLALNMQASPVAGNTGATPTTGSAVQQQPVAQSDRQPLSHQGTVVTGREPGSKGYFRPPSRDAYPDGKMGDTVRLGEAVFNATNTEPVSAPYVGNRQICSGCHLDAGRLANSAPLWASWVAYPAYRNKNDKVNTFIERVQGCFTYSMNAQASKAGHAPSANSDVMVALVSYAYWLASGAPTGDQRMAGRGFVELDEPAQGFDPKRGEAVYRDKCAVCHGTDGQGQTARGEIVFPPLWGAESFNWGAGMHKVNTAAAFIKLNMPFGLADPVAGESLLTDQQAWDVAAYMNSHERPQDPRFEGDLAETRKKFHDSRFDYYGTLSNPDGSLLKKDVPGTGEAP